MWGLARKDLMILAGVAAATFLMVIVVILCIVRMLRRKRKSKMEHLNRYEILVGGIIIMTPALSCRQGGNSADFINGSPLTSRRSFSNRSIVERT